MSLIVLARGSVSDLTTIENTRLDIGSIVAAVPDAQLARFIAQASQAVARARGRNYGHASYRERFDGLGRDVDDEDGALMLGAYPAFRIGSVIADGVALPPDAWELAGRSLHRLDGGMPRRWGGRSVTVEFQAGYRLPGEPAGSTAAPDLPADIEAEVIAEVNRIVHASRRDPMVTAERVEGVGGRSWGGDLPARRGAREETAAEAGVAEPGEG